MDDAAQSSHTRYDVEEETWSCRVQIQEQDHQERDVLGGVAVRSDRLGELCLGDP